MLPANFVPNLTPTPTPYAVELYVRGLDNYLWAEGYIVRGPNAGTLTTARIPYSTHRLDESTRKGLIEGNRGGIRGTDSHRNCAARVYIGPRSSG